MARIAMEEILEELDEHFERVLKSVIDELVPGNSFDGRLVIRTFRKYLERGFNRWEHVSNRCVDAGD